jgi:hypothetical protein
MQPQGTALINAQYFTDLTNQINAINICADLQELVDDAIASIQANIDSIKEQVDQLEALLLIPTNLSQVITWITNFQAQLLLPYTNYVTQLAETATAIANLVTAIENAAERIKNCTITIPTITIPILP